MNKEGEGLKGDLTSLRLEGIASRSEAIAIRLETITIAIRLETIAIRFRFFRPAQATGAGIHRRH